MRAVADGLIWVVALYLAALLRLDFDASRVGEFAIFVLVPVACLAQWTAGYWTGLYRGGQVYGSFDEVTALAETTTLATAVVVTADVVLPGVRLAPVSSAVASGMIAFLLMGGLRFFWRLAHHRSMRTLHADRTRTIVMGAGVGGARVIRVMLDDPSSPYNPVAIIDDDPDKANLSIMGVPVVGDRSCLQVATERTGAEAMLIAIPSASAALVRALMDLASPLDLEVRVVPSANELLGSEVQVSDIREPDERDLLGRHQVQTDLESAALYLQGRRVLVTGAGGSIGSELCRQIAAFEPAEIVMVDRDESALHAVQLQIEGQALLDSPDLVLLDIRDRVRVRELFLQRRPEVVFHAAALKHLPLLESHPVEALKTNVWGSLAVLEAAQLAGTRHFVNISTDKAANPCSTLGFSKRIAERLTAHVASAGPGAFVSVRFGNVLGSRGSVLTAFRSQLASGRPLTVTDPEVTRYFMTVEEAVQLVIQAGAIGAPAHVLVLDMGDPVRIADVARRLADQVDPRREIVFTGLRPGEKMHEELFGPEEIGLASEHPLITCVDVPPLDPSHVRDLDPRRSPEAIRATLASLCDLHRPEPRLVAS